MGAEHDPGTGWGSFVRWRLESSRTRTARLMSVKPTPGETNARRNHRQEKPLQRLQRAR